MFVLATLVIWRAACCEPSRRPGPKMTLEDERMMDHEADLEAAINLSTGQAAAVVRAPSATPTTNGVLHEDVADATPQVRKPRHILYGYGDI